MNLRNEMKITGINKIFEEYVIHMEIGDVNISRKSNYFLTSQIKINGVLIDPIVKPRTEVNTSHHLKLNFTQNQFFFQLMEKDIQMNKSDEEEKRPLQFLFKLFEVKPEHIKRTKSAIFMASKGKLNISINDIINKDSDEKKKHHFVCTMLEVPPNAAENKMSISEMKDIFGSLNFYVSIKKKSETNNLLRRNSNEMNISESSNITPSFMSSICLNDLYLKEKLRSINESEVSKYSFIFHGIFNLPTPMRVYITLKTTQDVINRVPAKAITITSTESRNFIWHDTLSLNIPKNRHINKVGLFVSVIDYYRKTYLAKCIIPTENIIPGEQYNLMFVINDQGTCVLTSFQLEDSLSFRSEVLKKYPDIIRLELFLQGVVNLSDKYCTANFTTSIAVVHIESNLSDYIRRIQTERPKMPFDEIHLDDAKAFENILPSSFRISKPSRKTSLYPQWNCIFKIEQSHDDFFNPNGAIIIEIFSLDYPKDDKGNVYCSSWAAIPLHELSQCRSKDGQYVKYSPPLHFFENRQNKRMSDPCNYGSECAHHDYALTLEIRKWKSRSYLKHITKLMREEEYSNESSSNIKRKMLTRTTHGQIPRMSIALNNNSSKSEPSSPKMIRMLRHKSLGEIVPPSSDYSYTHDYWDEHNQSNHHSVYSDYHIESPISISDLVSEDGDEYVTTTKSSDLDSYLNESDNEVNDFEDYDHSRKIKVLSRRSSLHNMNSSPTMPRRKSSTDMRGFLSSIIEENNERRKSTVSIDSQDLNEADWDSSDDELVELFKRRLQLNNTVSPPTSEKMVYSPTFGRRQADADLKPPYFRRGKVLRHTNSEILLSGSRSPKTDEYILPESIEDIIQRTEDQLINYENRRCMSVDKVKEKLSIINNIIKKYNFEEQKELLDCIIELEKILDEERDNAANRLNENRLTIELFMNQLTNDIKNIIMNNRKMHEEKYENELRLLRAENSRILSENEALRNKIITNGSEFSEELLVLKRKLKEKNKKIASMKKKLLKKKKLEDIDDTYDLSDEYDDTDDSISESSFKRKKDDESSPTIKKNRKK